MSAALKLPSPGDPEYERYLARAVLSRAEKARRDPKAFFSFVMKEETTRARIVTAAHQRVFFDFVEAHQFCVVRMPPGFSKTYCMAALTMRLLGEDTTARGAVISAARDQAAKPVAMVRDYIENKGGQHPELRLVYPHLRPSQHEADPWTQTKLVVDRPSGIRDPSLTAFGLEARTLIGSRLSWILVDDILDQENTATAEGRRKVIEWFGASVISRRDAKDARIVVTNTPWHPDDLTYFLEKKVGWPTLTMDADGNIFIANADEWDSDDIRPGRGAALRLAEHDSEAYGAGLAIGLPGGGYLPANDVGDGSAEDTTRIKGERVVYDVREEVTLWPERFGRAELDEILRTTPSVALYNRNYRMLCRSDEERRCPEEWVERCKENARRAGIFSLVASYDGANPTVTGVDLAFGEGKNAGETAFFTFEIIPERVTLPNGFIIPAGARRILDVEVGRFKTGDIVRKLLRKITAYKSVARVESNAAQKAIRDWALELDVSVPVRPHFTGKNKRDIVYGVESVFYAMENGAWFIPNDERGRCHPMVQKWIDDCIYYQPPPAHTGDALMASWFAAEQAREVWQPVPEQPEGAAGGLVPSATAGIMAR